MRSKSLKSSRPTKQRAKPTNPKPKKVTSPTAADARLDRPFADDLLKRARRVVADYQIVVIVEDGQWHGRGLELAHVYGEGATPGDCVENTREALTAAVAYLLENGQSVPVPAKHGKRSA